jgi:hypothetical protein
MDGAATSGNAVDIELHNLAVTKLLGDNRTFADVETSVPGGELLRFECLSNRLRAAQPITITRFRRVSMELL